MPLSAGDKIGSYEILAPIGEGGMGQVYRAKDTKLKREVALKVLPDSFAGDPERMARFQREAEVLAALNHPNIAQIYGLEERALVMELVAGETLQGPLPLETALNYARQIADALEAAHEKNIIHRDLKPANIMITPAGVVKVLDFGLAALPNRDREGADSVNSPTLTISPTRAGMILGTAGYMSPEQARGKPVDKRADIWAFGVVLFEMLTGKRLFEGETVSDTLAQVLTKEPDWERVPAKVRRLLKKCLEKDPKKRLRDIGDAWELLEDAPGATAPARSRLGTTGWIAAGVVTVIAAGLAFVHFREQPPAVELTRFQIPLPARATPVGPFPPQEVSPDGRKLVFEAMDPGGNWRLWIRSFDSLEARLLPGIDTNPAPAPFLWSYDSRFIAFWSSDHKLKKVNVSGGPAQTLCDAPDEVTGGSWSRDGVILFGSGRGVVRRVSDAGGTPTALTALDPARGEQGQMFPKLLPDGRHFLYFRLSNTPGASGIYLGSVDAKPSEQSTKPLLVNEAFPEYYVPSPDSGNGHLLFYREGTILAQPFDPSKLELSGDPVPVAEQVGNFVGYISFFSASDNGVLITVGGTGYENVQLTWLDRYGKNVGTVGDPENFRSFGLSSDGKQAAVTRLESTGGRKGNLWVFDLTRGGGPTRFTFDASYDESPVFSPDGGSVVFASNRDGPRNLYQKLTSRVKSEELLLKSDEQKYPYSWSGDGRYLLYSTQTQKTKSDVWILSMDESHKTMPFQAAEFNETGAQFSPDGHWIAYVSNESGHDEVYVREFLLGADGKPQATEPHQISNGGGLGPRWRADGKELFYVSLDRRTILSAEMTATKPQFEFSTTKLGVPLPATTNYSPAVTGDGKRFLVAVPAGQSGPQLFTVVLNWQAGLKK
jgi:serine/threonine protein kinase/Tol biopolymer transport system component